MDSEIATQPTGELFFQHRNQFKVGCEQFACPRQPKKVTEQQLNCCTYLASLTCGDVYGFRLMSERLSKIVVWGEMTNRVNVSVGS